MSQSASSNKTWSPWHQRLHKKLLSEPDLIPKGACLLLAISGGQDSMVLLKLILDLQKFHLWKINVWHGDHGWHNKSKKFAQELQNWCLDRNINFYSDEANKEEAKTEATAREWRYKKLECRAKNLSSINSQLQCKYILTGHTGSDRAETFIINLSRGADLTGLSSLQEKRLLTKKLKLIRPMLSFHRKETSQICEELNLPIWVDPSNQNMKLSRNRIRHKIIPIMEDLYPGCSLRIASLSEKFKYHRNDQYLLAILALKGIKNEKGLCRKSMNKLPVTLKMTLLSYWLKEYGIKQLKAKQLEFISKKFGPNLPPGCNHLKNGWQIQWNKESIELKHS